MYYFILILSLGSQLSMFLSLFPFLINRIEIEKKEIIFIYFIAFSTITEIVVDTSAFFEMHYLWTSHIYFSAEYFFFFFILYQWESRIKKLWLITGMMVGVFVLVDNFMIASFSGYATTSLSIQNLFLFLFSSWALVDITTKNIIPFYKDHRFYLVAGIILYSSITSLMFLFYDYFKTRVQFNIGFSAIVMMNFFFTYSMVLYYRQRKMLAEAFK